MKTLWVGMLIGFVSGIAFSEGVRADTYCADYGYTVQCTGANVRAWGYRTPYGRSSMIRQGPTFKRGGIWGGSKIDRYSWERDASQPSSFGNQLLPGLDW